MKDCISKYLFEPKYDILHFIQLSLYVFIIVNSLVGLPTTWFLKFLSHNDLQVVLFTMLLSYTLIKLKEKEYNKLVTIYKQRLDDKPNRNPFAIPLIQQAEKEIGKINRWKRGNTNIWFINSGIVCILSIMKLQFTF